MYYVINDYYNLLSSKKSIIMKTVVPVFYEQVLFYENLLNGYIDGLIVFVNNEENLKLLLLLNELDIPIIVVSNYDLKNLGLKVYKFDELLNLEFNKKDEKVTRPFLISIIEEYIDKISEEIKLKENIKRFISVQILYENPYFDYIVTDKISDYKKELNKKLKNNSKIIIDETLDYFIKYSFNIK